MKLDIYENKKVVKTYEADTYDLMFGTMEEIAKAANLDSLENINNLEILKLVGGMMTSSCRDTVKDLMKDIFDGLTDEELKKTKVIDVTNVLMDVIVYTLAQLYESFGGNEKN